MPSCGAFFSLQATTIVDSLQGMNRKPFQARLDPLIQVASLMQPRCMLEEGR